MPPHLHPRSTATSTLFAGTLLASFIVVGIPHVFPCPRPRTGYAADSGEMQIQFDEQGKPVRRRVKQPHTRSSNDDVSRINTEASEISSRQHKSLAESKPLDEEAALFRALAAEAEVLEHQAKQARECPVPKPSGWVGRMLGFSQDSSSPVQTRREEVEEARIEPLRRKDKG